jgi:hypothetical protein
VIKYPNQQRYYNNHREEIRKRRKKNRDKNHEEYLRKRRDYYQKHKTEICRKNKAFAKAHRRERRLANREYYKRLRLEVLTHYGGNPPKCACCGESHIEFLSIDHIKGGGNKHRKSLSGNREIYRWLIKNNFPEGFQILCHNCNLSKGFYGYCPHKEGIVID